MTELFIKKYSDEATLVNGNFASGITGWNVVQGTVATEFNKLYVPSDLGFTPTIRQDCLHKTGNYEITITVCETNFYPNPGAYSGFKIQIGDATTGWIYGAGKYTYRFNVTDITNQFSIQLRANFKYAITNVSVTLLDGVWHQLDLFEDTEIPLNFQISDINNIEARRAAYSNTITLPGSKNNNVIFEHLHNLAGVDTFPMSEKSECYILDGGLKIFEGYIEINKININQNNSYTYEALIYNVIIDLWEKIKDKYLRGNNNQLDDLDFSEYNHVYNSENIVRSFTKPNETPARTGYTGTATPGQGYTYALIDKYNKYAKDWVNGAHWKVDEITPCLYIKEIWDKIFEKTGYTYTSTFLNSDFFKRLVYPASNSVIRDLTVEDREFSALDSSVKDPNHIAAYPADFQGYPSHFFNSAIYPQAWNDIVTTTNFTHNATSGYITATRSGYYDVEINLVYDRNIEMLYKNGSTWDPLPDASPVSTGQMSIVTTFETKIVRANGLPFNPTYDLLDTNDNIYELPAETDSYGSYMYPTPPEASHRVSKRVFLNVGDSIVTNLTNVITYGWSGGESTFWPYRYDADPQAHEEDWRDVMVNLIATARTEQTNIVIKADNIITENMMMNLNMILHDNVLQSDFIKSVITMFNLYLEQSSPTNYIIEPRDDFYNTYTEIQDLTDKVDFDTYSAERPQIILGTDLTFTYDEDNDTFNDEYKKCTEKVYGQYEKKSPVGLDEKEIKVIFAPIPSGALTEMKDTLGRNHFDVPKIFKVTDDNRYDTDATFKPRILYWNGWTSTLFSVDGWIMYGCNGRRVATNGYYEGQVGYDFGDSAYIGNYPYVGHLNLPFGNETIDLNFGACDWYWSYFPTNEWVTNANLYNTYYTNIINELTANDARMVTFSAVLSSKDILDIKFYNPICIDGVYYRLYQIEDFVPGKECTIRLLKSLYIQDQFVEKLPRPVAPIFIGNLTRPTNNNSVIDIINGGTLNIIPGTIVRPINLPVDLYDPNMTRGAISTVTSYDVIDGNDEYTINGYLYDKLVLFAEKEDRNNVKVDLFDPNYSESLTVDEMLNGKKESSMERLKKI